MVGLIKLTLGTEIKAIYDSEIIFDYDAKAFYAGDTSEIPFEELDEDYLKFALFEEIDVPTDIKEFLKLLNTISKTFETPKQKYWLIMNEFEDIVTNEQLNELFDLVYLVEKFHYLQIFEIQYLDVNKVKKMLKDNK